MITAAESDFSKSGDEYLVGDRAQYGTRAEKKLITRSC